MPTTIPTTTTTNPQVFQISFSCITLLSSVQVVRKKCFRSLVFNKLWHKKRIFWLAKTKYSFEDLFKVLSNIDGGLSCSHLSSQVVCLLLKLPSGHPCVSFFSDQFTPEAKREFRWSCSIDQIWSNDCILWQCLTYNVWSYSNDCILWQFFTMFEVAQMIAYFGNHIQLTTRKRRSASLSERIRNGMFFMVFDW